MTPERLAKVRSDFAIIDNLPASVRALIHEHGSRPVMDLYARGYDAARIEQHFTNMDVFDDLF